MIGSFGIPDVGTDTRLGIGFVLHVISLVLEHEELVGLVVGTIVCQIRHPEQ